MVKKQTPEQELKQYLKSNSQNTLKKPIAFSGVGIHSGIDVTMIVNPAPANTGIVFSRTDLPNSMSIKAIWSNVTETHLCTILSNVDGIKVATVEHILSALYACGIDNALITMNAQEVPIMDGSSLEFIKRFDEVGTITLNAYRKEIIILEEVEIRRGDKWAKLIPSDVPKYTFDIDFSSKLIKKQHFSTTFTKESYMKEIAAARTFGFYEEIAQLKSMGFARGGTLQNAVVVGKDKILNDDGLRYPNEFVRHKILDAIGDLSLAGCAIRGHYIANCSGHAMNNQLLRMLFQDTGSFSYNS